MNLLDIGKKIAGLGLTALGTAVGGPAGAFVGGEVANLLGLGGDAKPEDIAKKIDANPAMAKLALAKLNAEHEEAMAGYVSQQTQIKQTGQTMRAEIVSDDAYVRRWRPTWGYVTAAAWLLQALAILAVVIGGIVATLHGNGAAATTLFDGATKLVAALTVQWGLALTVLGVNSSARSKDKQVAAGQTPAPGLISAIAQRIAPNPKETNS